jgi:hypothetical protein
MFKTKVLKLFRKAFGPWVTPPPGRKPRPTFKPRLEPLEERRLLDATTDTLIWNPQGGSQNAAVGTNYYDQTTGQQIQQAQLPNGPTATNPIELDGSKPNYNQPITVSQQMTVASLTVQNNYNNTMTISNFGTLITNAPDTVQSGSTLTLVSASSFGIQLVNSNNFTVQSGGTLNLRDPIGNTESGNAFLSAQQNNAAEYLFNQGAVTWTGTAVASGQQGLWDAIDAPVLNTGTFTVDGGTQGIANAVGATLDISGSDVELAGNSFYQASGPLNLQNGASLNCFQGYYQSGGQISSDSSVCALGSTGDGATGVVNIAGGKVIVDTVANTVGPLKFQATSVEFNGELDLSGLLTGDNGTQSDILNCGTATVTFGPNSFLNVGTTGNGNLGTGNRWTVMTYGSKVNTWGQQPSLPPGMSASTNGTDVLVSN